MQEDSNIATAERVNEDRQPQGVPISNFKHSHWHMRYGCAPDGVFARQMADDIAKNGQQIPIDVMPDPSSDGYLVLDGMGRISGQTLLRGKGGCLYPAEFRVHEGLTEADERCLSLAAGGNQKRRTASPHEVASYAARLIAELNVDQGKVAEVLGLSRPTLNRLLKLMEHWEALPESWKNSLGIAPYSTGGETSPIITFAHWYVAAAAVERGMTPGLKKLLDTAFKKEWSSRLLQLQIKDFLELDGAESAAVPDKPIKPADILAKTIQAVSKAEELMAKYGVLGDVTKFLADAKELLAARLAELKPAKKADKPIKGRKVKSAKATKVQAPGADAAKVPEQTGESPARSKPGRPRKVPAPAPAPTTADEQMEVAQTT